MSKIVFPVFVMETETGDFKLLKTLADLRLIVEEFWDILNEDFRFWDKSGYPLVFTENFYLEGDEMGICRISSNESDVLRSSLIKFAKTKGISIDSAADVVDIYEKIIHGFK